MSRIRTAMTSVITIAGSILISPQGSSAQTYPSQPIRIIVPTAPGGVADIAGRAFSQKLNEGGKTTIVENRTGAGGAIAADFVAKSAPDGYTVYVGFHATQAILPHLQKLAYDAEKDFVPITIAVKSSNILVVNPAIPAQTLPDLVAYAKANRGKVTFASQGNGSSGHIVGEQIKQVAGIDIVHVPYRGAAPAVQDLVAGHVSMMFDILTLAIPQIKANTVRALAITTAQRDPLVPNVPTAAEAGYPQLEGGPWFGFFVPARTPRVIVDWLHAEAQKAFSGPDVRARFAEQGLAVILGTPEQTAAFVAAESKRWGEVIRRANITLE
ncbi:MAG TPA: tripartite tricarboxylate transporter substrate binding protein [Xanthobacteraceae bacterium]|nr:tripartite tricarboxylate transporter substrate binding protein [Xanthobacteraceae bacterium]